VEHGRPGDVLKTALAVALGIVVALFVLFLIAKIVVS
jgi:hypothetical protein